MAVRTCYRHPARTTGASCTRCARPICPDCMVQAPVGHHCPTCVAEARGDMRKVRRVAFARRGGGRPGAGVVAGLVAAALIAVNVVVFVLDLGGDLTLRFADNAALVAAGEYYRMLTAAFLHSGLLHLAFNMLGLYLFGSQVEGAVGSGRFLALYLLAAVAGSATSHFFGAPFTYGVGASGAVFGIFGAFFVIARARSLDTAQIGGLIVVNLLIGAVVPRIDNAAHVGGLVTGAVIATVYEWAGRRRGSGAVAAQVGAVAAVAVLIAVATQVRVEQLRCDELGGAVVPQEACRNVRR